MMKLIVCTLALLALPNVVDAQIDEKKREHALFEVTHNGQTAFSTDVRSTDAPFDTRQAVAIANSMMEKEEIFGVELLNDGNTLRVYHLSGIDLDTVKSFVVQYKTNVSVEEPVQYEFQ